MIRGSLGRFIKTLFSFDLTPVVPIYGILGVPLLYASAYFLPTLGTTGSYLLGSTDLISLIVMPTLFAWFVGAGLLYAIPVITRKWCGSGFATSFNVVFLALMTLIAMKGICDAASYDWQNRIPRGTDILFTLRVFKLIILMILLGVVWFLRRKLPQLLRILSSVGFAFAVLATVRLWMLSHQNYLTQKLSPTNSRISIDLDAYATVRHAPRVVWVIFDETDFLRLSSAMNTGILPNFAWFRHASVYATNANSPASATLYSVPALLTGVPISGDGIKINGDASLSLQDESGRLVPFNEATSIFGQLATTGRTASVLGFYHPYCRLFLLRRCDSFSFPESGAVDSAIWSNVPDVIAARVQRLDPWEEITRNSLRLLPQYLAQDDSLTFIHLNFPHLPASYADNMRSRVADSNPLNEYKGNLVFTDEVLGTIKMGLLQQAGRHDLLVVISTDHWLRNRSYQPNVQESSRPVPFIVWKVGENSGYTLSQPLSTVHTSAMIMEYLNGNLRTQADIVRWWEQQSVYPSFVAPNT